MPKKTSLNSFNLAESLIKSQPGLFILFDKEGWIHWWNTRLENYTGYSSEQIRSLKLLDFIDEQDRKIVQEKIDEAFQEGMTDIELRLKGKTDETIYFLLTWVAVELKGEDFIIATGVDITKQKQQQAQKERYFNILEKSKNEILMYDADTLNLIYVNKGARKNLGYSLEKLKSMKIYDIKCDFDDISFRDHVRPLLKGQEDQLVFQTFCQRSDGSRYDVEVSVELEESEEQNILVCIASDITKRLQQEWQIKASLREKEHLLKEVHHRVKNNMAVISSLLNIQASKVNNDLAKTILNENMSRVKSMALIHQMLYEQDDFSEIDFETYLEKLIKVIEENYSSKNNHIKIEIDVQNFRFKITDAVPIALIVNELLTNAYKHACNDQSKCTIKVSVTREHNINTLIVSDDGIGLPKKFDLDKSTGMGMTLVKGLTSQLRGELSIQQNKGLSFILNFPA
ncbi:MAG: PAS domain S-box protein [Balneolales bacterium]